MTVRCYDKIYYSGWNKQTEKSDILNSAGDLAHGNNTLSIAQNCNLLQPPTFNIQRYIWVRVSRNGLGFIGDEHVWPYYRKVGSIDFRFCVESCIRDKMRNLCNILKFPKSFQILPQLKTITVFVFINKIISFSTSRPSKGILTLFINWTFSNTRISPHR